MKTAFLEVGALFEAHWTGIPNVVAGIARYALADDAIDWRFLYDTVQLPRAMVVEMLAQRSGAGRLDQLAQLVWSERTVPAATAATAAAIFPNIKPAHRLFGREASIVHDLSPLLTPQFHNADNIIHFANRIHLDVDSSDHVFCVSEATRQDVFHYLGMSLDRMSVIRLGVDIDPADLSAAHVRSGGIIAEPFVAVIGTLEPRKNGRILLDYLRSDPKFADRQRVVFIGREGWLDERESLMERVAAAGVRPGRIVFTGFVSETDKLALMLNSRFCIYPSFFEGFGLPILEAGVLGKITVCSHTSSMREVMPDRCIFFDPANSEDFGRALRLAERQAEVTRSGDRCRSDILADAAGHGWHHCYATIAAWVVQQ